MMDDNKHARISARAHELWEAAGRPSGQDDSFWFQAVTETAPEIPDTSDEPANMVLRQQGGVIDQRQQQIDPAGKHRIDQNANSAKRSQKQPGQSLKNPQDTEAE